MRQILLIVLGLVFLIVAESALAKATTFKIATIAPENSQWMIELKAASEIITERTEGRVKLKFYGGGVMGNDKKVLRKIRIGQLQGGAFTASGLAERYPDIVLYGLPMAFQSQEEVDYVRERMDPVLLAGLEEAGFISFGFAGGGFAKLMGSEPVTDLKELRGRKVWVPEGDPISYQAMEAMNLSPVVLPLTDVLTGLQTGLLEYVATPPVGAVILQWYTKVDYVMTLPFAYSMGTLVIDKRAFSRISESDQTVVREMLTDIYSRFEQRARIDDRGAEEALRDSGLEFVDADPALVPEWRAIAAASNRRMAEEGLLSVELMDTMLGYIEELHNGSSVDQAAPNSAR
ncbi:MAG: TRAP transporter substrate-binding protein DctP [Gammaproteobacteria bacterium]|nr:TRAP transporter substrate-binding protein DctP [Gammaproteobacteria bacterium]